MGLDVIFFGGRKCEVIHKVRYAGNPTICVKALVYCLPSTQAASVDLHTQ